jgi:signal transduction histidine kinase/ActR/RegA family two-component response regulator
MKASAMLDVGTFAGSTQRRPVLVTLENTTRHGSSSSNSSCLFAEFAACGHRLAGARTPQDAARIIFNTAAKLLEWEGGTFDLYLPEENMLQPVLNVVVVDGQRAECEESQTCTTPLALAQRVLKEGGQLFISEPFIQAHLNPGEVNSRPASIICVPMRDGLSIRGFISLQSSSLMAFGQESLHILQTLADHCASVLDTIAREAQEQTVREFAESSRQSPAAPEQCHQSDTVEAVAQVAGGAARGFDELLTIIRASSELLLMSDRSLAGQSRQLLTEVVAASARAASLTRQLLALSRDHPLQLRPINLNETVGNLARVVGRSLGENIRVQCRCSGLPSVPADACKLDQVLLNLVLNARDALPDGGQVVISTEPTRFEEHQTHVHPERRAGDFVCLSVADNGRGIAPEHLGRIFEPFFTTKLQDKGAGLGLAIVFGIVRQHQGWIEVDSQPGKGSLFRVFLPVVREAALAAPAPEKWAPRPTPATSEPKPMIRSGTETILVIEEDDPVRALAQRILGDLGYRVLTVDSVHAACETWQAYGAEIDLLVTGVRLPNGGSGRELAQQFRAQRSALKVLLVSGFSAEAISEHTSVFQRSRSHLLLKPYSSRALTQTVRQCLDHA